MTLFNPKEYVIMFDNDEMWFCTDVGSAMLIADISLMDC